MAKTKTAVAACALALAGTLGIAYVSASVATQSWNPTEWVKPATEITRPAPDLTDSESHDNVIISDDGESHGIALMSARIAPGDYAAYGVSPNAETAFTLTATVKDTAGSTDGIPQAISELTAEWENASTGWAKGKDINEYFTIERVTENSFIVTCLDEFGTPALLKAKAAGTDIYGTKKCNYLKKLKSVTFHADNISSINISNFANAVTIEPVFGTGTVQGEVVYNEVTVEFIDAFKTLMTNSSYYKYFEQQCNAAGVTYNWEGTFDVNCSTALTAVNPDAFPPSNKYELSISWEGMFVAGMSNVAQLKSKTNSCEYFRYAIEYAAQNNGAPLDLSMQISYQYKYNGKIYSSGESFKENCSLTHNEFMLPAVGSVVYDTDDDLLFYLG